MPINNSSTKIFQASVCRIPVGTIQIEGLLLENGEFAITIQQCVTLFQVCQNNAQRDFKALLGKDRRFVKIRVKNARARKPENCVLLLDFEFLMMKLDRKGNIVAQNLRDCLTGLSLVQLFSDAFKIEFEAQERQEYLVQRQSHREIFHSVYTIWLKKDGCIGHQYAQEVNRLKLVLDLPIASVDNYGCEQIARLNRGESAYDALRKAGLSHQKALEILSI